MPEQPQSMYQKLCNQCCNWRKVVEWQQFSYFRQQLPGSVWLLMSPTVLPPQGENPWNGMAAVWNITWFADRLPILCMLVRLQFHSLRFSVQPWRMVMVCWLINPQIELEFNFFLKSYESEQFWAMLGAPWIFSLWKERVRYVMCWHSLLSDDLWDCNVNGKEGWWSFTWWNFMICLMKILDQEGHVGDHSNFHFKKANYK